MAYLNNPARYVADLAAAAEAEDWNRYASVQSQFSVESTLSALQQLRQQEQAAKRVQQNSLQQVDSN
jgi:hypothetical protein